MTALTVILALAVIAAATLAVFFFVKWQATLGQLREAEKDLAKSGSSQDLEDRFKLLSQETLDRQEEKATRQISSLLTPVREEVAGFRKRVEEYVQESRSAKDILNEKFSRMDQSVATLSSDAKELADALRGSAKLRGDWGETVLRRLLEIAGLREGESFSLQRSFAVDGQRLRPDAVIMLPDSREVVVDSKVSLVDYEDYFQASDDEGRVAAAKALRNAVERQVEETSKYNGLPDLNTPGFTFMFAPIEPAWLLIASEFPELIEKAQRKGVVILGPTNLLVALKVVDQIWLAEKKVQNMRKIFDRAEKVVDASARLTERVDTALKRMESATKSVEDVRTTLRGKQGVLAHAHKLSDYGVKGKEALPEELEEFPGSEHEA